MIQKIWEWSLKKLRYRPTKFEFVSGDELILKTETGHIVKFRLKPELSTDIDNEDNGNPFFYLTLTPEYTGVEPLENALNLKQVSEKLTRRNLLNNDLDYDHIQVGFVYAEGDPNNHRWMLNFMNGSNKYIFGFIADNVKLNCPFTTTSWEDGIWHGRFVIQKKDVEELIETDEGNFELYGKGDIGQQQVTPLEDKVNKISLRYNIYSNMWYAELKNNDEKIGEIPCKNIICDVPFEGNIDRTFPKPKVTADLDINQVAGTSLALNALIIKRK